MFWLVVAAYGMCTGRVVAHGWSEPGAAGAGTRSSSTRTCPLGMLHTVSCGPASLDPGLAGDAVVTEQDAGHRTILSGRDQPPRMPPTHLPLSV
ncbi:MAG: hypothetical protein IPJ15_10505 [Actinomycetales bacterium]|nr:hypothetical protein [Candidatus Phosphoribacter baldrii]